MLAWPSTRGSCDPGGLAADQDLAAADRVVDGAGEPPDGQQLAPTDIDHPAVDRPLERHHRLDQPGGAAAAMPVHTGPARMTAAAAMLHHRAVQRIGDR